MRRRSTPRAVFLWLLVMGCVGTAAHADAQAAGLGFNWVRLAGAESCIAAGELMQRLENRAGRIVFVRAGEAALSLDGYVQAVAGPPRGWAVTLEVSDAQGRVLGHRDLGVLEGEDCSVVAQAAELIFDLTLDADGILGAGIPLEPATQRMLDQLLRGEPFELDPATLPKNDAPAQAATEPPKPAPVIARREPEETPEPTVLSLSAIGSLGEAPKGAIGAALRVSLPLRLGWSLELGVALFPERFTRLDEPAGRAGVGMQLGSVALCPLRWGVTFALCAGPELGRQDVTPRELVGRNTAVTQTLLDLHGYGRLRIALLPAFSLRLTATVVVPLLSPEYHYESPSGNARFFRTAPVAGRLEAGLGLQL